MHLFLVKHVDGRFLAFTDEGARAEWLAKHEGESIDAEATLFPSLAHAEVAERGRWEAFIENQAAKEQSEPNE